MDSLLPPSHGFTTAADPRPHFWGIGPLWARVVMVGLLYAATGWLSVHFTLVPGGPSMLWLPNAVVLAALLLSPRRQWLCFAAVVVPVELLVEGLQALVVQTLALHFCALHQHKPMKDRLLPYLHEHEKPALPVSG